MQIFDTFCRYTDYPGDCVLHGLTEFQSRLAHAVATLVMITNVATCITPVTPAV